MTSPIQLANVKKLVESSDLQFIPSNYVHSTTINPGDSSAIDDLHDDDDDDANSIPIVDFSLLISDDPHQRAKSIHDLSKACQDWGLFIVVNHGIAESLMKGVVDGAHEFFNLPEEEKQEFAGKHVLDPIRCGTSFNASKENVFFWRDYLKVLVHPHFHFPNKPQGYSDIVSEYCERSRKVARKLLGGISESLGLEESFLDKALDLELGLQTFIANYYPRCPQPELAMGLPAHSDQGVLSILINNQVQGLQLQHKGKWIHVNALPNSLLVNIADHLEIFSNGKYKSSVHRAVVNNKKTRISIVTFHGPSLETIVSPAFPLLDNDNSPAVYGPMKYRDYLEFHQSNQLVGKSCLERIKIRKN